MTTFQREISVPGQLEDLPKILQFVEESCQAAHVQDEACFDLQLAVEEAATNVIEHAYGRRGGRFDVRFETRGRDVRITIHDWGQAFDPAHIRRPDFTAPLEKRPLGGLGLHLMEQLMDEVTFTFSPDQGNLLVMVKLQALAAE